MSDKRQQYKEEKSDHFDFLRSIQVLSDRLGIKPAEICRQTGIDPAQYSRVMNQTRGDCYKSFSALSLVQILKVLGFKLTISVDQDAGT